MTHTPNNTAIMVAIAELKKDVQNINEKVGQIKPVVDDYERMKNRGIGIWFALTMLCAVIGSVAINKITKWFG